MNIVVGIFGVIIALIVVVVIASLVNEASYTNSRGPSGPLR